MCAFHAYAHPISVTRATAFEEMRSQTKIVSEKKVFKGAGGHLDKEDLETKYHNKPERLQNILKNTHKIWDEVGLCEMYQDIQHDRAVSVTHEKTEERKREIMAERQVNKNKGPGSKEGGEREEGACCAQATDRCLQSQDPSRERNI